MTFDKKHDQAARVKKPYQKPTLIEVALRPDEAVLGNCKVSGASGPGGRGTCHPIGNCSSQGS